MSNLAEIKQHIDRLKELLIGLKDPVTSTALVVSVAVEPTNPLTVMRERLQGMLKVVAPGAQERFKKAGMRLGAGAGIGVVGLTMMGVAALYLMGVVTLLVNRVVGTKDLNSLWLSALIVVGGTLVIGCIIALIGAVIGRSGAKRLQKTADAAGQGVTELSRKTIEEIQEEVGELQVLARKELEGRKKQALELLDTARRLAPAGAAVLLLFALVWRRRRKRKKLLAQTPVVIKEVIYAEG